MKTLRISLFVAIGLLPALLSPGQATAANPQTLGCTAPYGGFVCGGEHLISATCTKNPASFQGTTEPCQVKTSKKKASAVGVDYLFFLYDTEVLIKTSVDKFYVYAQVDCSNAGSNQNNDVTPYCSNAPGHDPFGTPYNWCMSNNVWTVDATCAPGTTAVSGWFEAWATTSNTDPSDNF
jgi:hypothetical protein